MCARDRETYIESSAPRGGGVDAVALGGDDEPLLLLVHDAQGNLARFGDDWFWVFGVLGEVILGALVRDGSETNGRLRVEPWDVRSCPPNI